MKGLAVFFVLFCFPQEAVNKVTMDWTLWDFDASLNLTETFFSPYFGETAAGNLPRRKEIRGEYRQLPTFCHTTKVMKWV